MSHVGATPQLAVDRLVEFRIVVRWVTNRPDPYVALRRLLKILGRIYGAKAILASADGVEPPK